MKKIFVVLLVALAAIAYCLSFFDANSTDFLNGTFSNTTVEGIWGEANVTLGGEFAANGSEQVGYWKFNNDSNYGENDTHAFDYSGNGNNGTNVGATWTPSGKFGGALSFDGTGDNYVDVGTDASLELGAAFAVEAWIKPIVLGTYSGIVSKDSPGRVSDPYSWMFVCHNDGTIGSYTGYPGGWSFSSNAGITAGNWYHVAWVVNGGSVYYYVNGVNYGSAGFGYSVVDSNIVYIGSWLAGEPTFAFKGIIDNVAIYNRALSAGEVLDHYKAGALNLAMQVAASTDNFIWSDWANYSASQSSGFLLNFNGGRYLKYKAAFSTENADYSPMLSDAFAAYAPEETSFVAINIKAGFQTINFTHMNAYGTYHTLSDSKTWTAEADFNSGSPANVTVTGYADGEIQLSGTNSTGSFTSSPFGSGLLVNWQEINWTAPVAYGQETPANGSEQVGYWKFNENSETPYNQSGAIGWWRFNNASAYGESDSLAFDYSGNGNNGTINGAAYVDGKFSKALDFDGTDDYVDYGDACDLTGSFAIEAWIKTSQTGGMIITKIKENTAWNYQINVDGSGHLQAYVGGWVTSTGTVNDNRWRHVALVSDGSTGHLYIDGIQDGSGAISPTANNYPLYVGAYESLGGGVGGFFDGTIDDIIIYNRGLSADEIREDYLRGAGTRDYSGNGNNGTNHGASWTSGGEFGGALDFDGSTSYVTVPDSAAFDFGSGDFAIETWIYPTAEPAVMGEIINKAAASSYSPWRILRANGGEIQWYMANATPLWTAYANTGLYAPLNTWTHIAMARTSGTVTVYVNGVASTPASANFALYNPTVDVCLGRLCLHGTPYYFQGLMDNAIIYNRSLSAGEVLNHYEAGILDLTMQSRYGNTSSPDGTWSGWYSHGNQAGSGIGVQSHYMQWKAVFSTEKAGYSPVLNDTAVSFASAAAPIIVENEGTVAANVSIYASDMFYSAPNPSQRYLFRVSDYEPGSIGEGSATEWTEMPSAGAPVVAVASLGYSPSANEARIDVKVVVPSDEPPGQKNSTVILSASQA
ncbi:MAG: LamG domain-containing protein [Candidatus Micrarchaeota archaeon]|nr:LamG domain-containing protein [Candidatus Micrarchaeota archaeon]